MRANMPYLRDQRAHVDHARTLHAYRDPLRMGYMRGAVLGGLTYGLGIKPVRVEAQWTGRASQVRVTVKLRRGKGLSKQVESLYWLYDFLGGTRQDDGSVIF